MRRNLNSLASIASTAPFLGVFGAILGIYNSFGPLGTERSTAMAAVFEGLSESLAPVALSLFVALPALWCYRYLSNEVASIDLEMENASLDLLNYLTALLGRRNRLALI